MSLGKQAQERCVFQPGPLFANLVLADEINRAPAKVQSALLEAMEERQVTVGGKTHRRPELFMVLATQNPIEQEGPSPLPEAQKARFLLHVAMSYPDDTAEQTILRLVRAEKGGDTGEALAPIAQHMLFAARLVFNDVQVTHIRPHRSQATVRRILEAIVAMNGRAVAQATGGQYFFAADRTSLEGIYSTLDQVETRQVETIAHRPQRDLFHWPLGCVTLVAVTYPLASSALGMLRGRRRGVAEQQEIAV
jgi:MoxR-like ATPase